MMTRILRDNIAPTEGFQPSTPYNPSERNTQLKLEHLMAMYGWYSPSTSARDITRAGSTADIAPQSLELIENVETETAEMPVLASAGT